MKQLSSLTHTNEVPRLLSQSFRALFIDLSRSGLIFYAQITHERIILGLVFFIRSLVIIKLNKEKMVRSTSEIGGAIKQWAG